VPWLRLRVLPATATDEQRMARAEADEKIARAGRLADAALASAPDAPASSRVKIDVLRLAGQQDVARGLVSKIIGQASQPETAYVLAALDLAEPEPLWTTVLDRLRVAATGEGAAGRARAALVYALAKSGDVAGAKVELARLDALPRPYPLSPNLHAMVERTPTKGALDAGADAAPAGKVAAAAAPAPGPAAGGGATAPAPAGDGVPGDSRSAMALASAAYKKGDFGRAQQIYEAIVTRNPSDSEAVSALGDVARAQGDLPRAIASYKRAISVNPSYLPALLGLADTQWAGGDRAGATRGYSDIVDRFPEGTYPAYVKQRVEGASAPKAPAAAAGGTTDESSP
jgi:tetratricopeptide (TPR) repeat protein